MTFSTVSTTQQEEGRERRISTFRITQLFWLVLGFFEALLALRVVFKLIGVNGDNPFAGLIYGITGIFVAPFASLIGTPSSGGMSLEISTIIAMIVYALVGWGIIRFIEVLFYRPRGPISVRQSVVNDSAPVLVPVGVNQTTVTERTNSIDPRIL
jgi:hypothetical protein